MRIDVKIPPGFPGGILNAGGPAFAGPFLCSLSSALVAAAPDALLLSGLDELLAEVGVGEVHKGLGAFPGAASGHVGHAVLGGDVVGLAARGGYNLAVEVRHDVAAAHAVLADAGGCDADEGLAALALGCAGEEVNLSAGAGDVPESGALGFIWP